MQHKPVLVILRCEEEKLNVLSYTRGSATLYHCITRAHVFFIQLNVTRLCPSTEIAASISYTKSSLRVCFVMSLPRDTWNLSGCIHIHANRECFPLFGTSSSIDFMTGKLLSLGLYTKRILWQFLPHLVW